MSEEPEPKGRLQIQWIIPEGSPEAKEAFKLEIERLALSRQIHEDWLRTQDRSHELQERSHQAWVEKNERAIAAWERMAIALEEIAVKGWSS